MYDDYEFDGQESGASTIVGVLILCVLILGGAVGLIWYLQGPFVGRKFISALVEPLGIFWILLFFGAMTATFTKQKFLALLLWVMMISLSMLGNTSIANSLIAGLEEPQRANAEISAEDVYDYGFVLGGGVAQNKYDEFDFNDAGERFTDAVRLYKKGVIKHLVFTGSPFLYSDDEAKAKRNDAEPTTASSGPDANEGNSAEAAGDPSSSTESADDTPSNSNGPFAQDEPMPEDIDDSQPAMQTPYEESLRKLLKDVGVAQSDYSFLGGRYTSEEMLRIDEFLKDKANTKNAMITSAWHMNRAAKLRLAQGLDMKSVPVDFRTITPKDDPTFFVPKITAFHTSSTAIKEYLAGWIQ